ncbi:hypothetical protein [Ralstonia wenshanensis]|uniref:hypothetical protein n=1 Tax=Ralstonia wenshanensis TaxID=2842456 RepID=UPI003D992671
MNNKEKEREIKVLPEYHIFPFKDLHESYYDLIKESYLNRPLEIRRNSIRKHLGDERGLSPEKAHEVLSNVLTEIESNFKKIILKHSCFYWIHVYRRLAPKLSSKLGGNTGPITLAWVRAIAEQAIFKFGKMQGILDVQLANSVPPKSILGGHLLKSLRKREDRGFAEWYIGKVAESPQWVVTNFRPSDLAGIYFIEGLAFQYWYITAKLRAAGKGVSIKFELDGEIEEMRSVEDNRLIGSFDDRIEVPKAGFASNVGTFVRHFEPREGRSLPCLFHNVDRHPMPQVDGVQFSDMMSEGEFVPNYFLGWLDVAEYYVAHKYLEKSFRKRHGFGLHEFCVVAYGMSAVLAGLPLPGEEALDNSYAYNLHYKLQRGYIFSGLTVGKLKSLTLEFCQDLRLDPVLRGSSIASEIDKVIEFLSLTTEKQSTISLWSLGPRFVIVRYQEFVFFDLSAWPVIFKNLFFGLRNYDPSSKKGPEFEFAFAELARANGFDVILESKEIELGGQKREVDVAIRFNDRLFVCECRASERPLNFEIGNPATIRIRNDDLYSKVEQAMSLAELFKKYPRGSNYDVTWAKEIVAIVVSPYVEWIWSMRDELWISRDKLIPRIMASGEAINFIKSC